MPLKTESRNWFERGVFDLAIAQAHLQSGSWSEGAKLSRQAALKFLQAVIVSRGEPNPSPRMRDLLSAASAETSLSAKEEWHALDTAIGDVQFEEEDARRYYRYAEEVRDAVGKALEGE